ncbi:hypothetical protein D3C81_1215290 [compost metagenome]
MIGGGEHLLLAGGCQHQIIFRRNTASGKGLQLHAQGWITGLQAGGIDQDHALAQQRLKGLGQRLPRIHMSNRHIEDPPQGLELLLGTDTETVHAHQRQVLRAVLEHITRRQFGQGGGLAHAGRTDHGNDTAFLDRFDFRHINSACQVRQQHAPGMTRLFDAADLLQQLMRQRAGQTNTLQAPPKVGLLWLIALQLAPGQRAELDFKQFAQPGKLRAHGIEQARVHRRGGRGRRDGCLDRRLDQRLRGGQRQTGKQLAVTVFTFAATAELGLGGDDARLGLAQFIFELDIRNPWRQGGQLVVQRSRQLDTASNPSVADDGGISPQLISNQLHGLTHIGGEKTLNLHNPLPQPLGPTVATMVTCLLSGIS